MGFKLFKYLIKIFGFLCILSEVILAKSKTSTPMHGSPLYYNLFLHVLPGQKQKYKENIFIEPVS